MNKLLLPMSLDDSIGDPLVGALTEYSRNTMSVGKTGQPAMIYIPSDTWVLNTSLELYVGAVLMGNALDLAVLKAA